MMEERRILLHTGVYADDDPIIIELDAQIRARMSALGPEK